MSFVYSSLINNEGEHEMTDLDTLLAEMPKTGPFYDDITPEEAAKRYTVKELAYFHNCNENGVRADWRKLSERLIAFGRGYAAYGDVGYLDNELSKMASYKTKRVNSRDLRIIVEMIRDTIARGEQFLAENNA